MAAVTGWLPSQIEKEDYGTLMAVIDELKKRMPGGANKSNGQSEAEFNKQLMAERKAIGM